MADVQSAASPSTSTTRPDAKKRMPSILYATVQRIFRFFSIQSIFGFFSISVASIRYVISQRIFPFSASSPSSVKETAVGPLSSPSTTGSYQSVKYDIFINHRGCDAKMWAGIVCDYLKCKGLRVFLDSREFEFGDDIPDKIKHAIRSASVHIAILSENYASSVWCLEELHLMLQSEALIVPVFYCVPPSVPRHCTGSYDDAFTKLQHRWGNQQIEKWKEALKKVSNQYGPKFTEDGGDNGKCTWTDVVNHVYKEAMKSRWLSVVAEHPVGLEEAVEDFDRRKAEFEKKGQKNPKLVGIVGMCGSGKTTLAKELFKRKRSEFDASCFLFDVREKYANKKLPTLQRQLITELLPIRECEISSLEYGLALLKDHFIATNERKFLVVLDGIDNGDQLVSLCLENLLETDSLIIITSRDRCLFRRHPTAMLYEMKPMDKNHAEQLFCQHAFGDDHPESGFKKLVEYFLAACYGLPLLLSEWGSRLRGISNEKEWQSELQYLSRMPTDRIKGKLQTSYDALDRDHYKQMFLDAACFFFNHPKNTAIQIWDASEWSGEQSLQTLKYKGLIDLLHGEILKMHDLLRHLGQDIAAASVPRRLWKREDIRTLEKMGFRCVLRTRKSLKSRSFLQLPCSEKAQASAYRYSRDLSKNKNSPAKDQSRSPVESSRVEFFLDCPEPKALSPSTNLLWLKWENCAQKCIPAWIPIDRLCHLEIIQGELKELWQDNSEAPLQLRELIIQWNPLTALPIRLGSLTSLEHIDFHGCNRLKSLPESFSSLTKLQYLDLSECASLRIEPCNLSFGQSQSTYQDSLRTLRLLGTNVNKEVLNQIVKLNSLECLTIGCDSLSSLPSTLGNLTRLTTLCIGGCKKMISLPTSMRNLSRLKELTIRASGVRYLPEDIFVELTNLQALEVEDCPIKELTFTNSKGKTLGGADKETPCLDKSDGAFNQNITLKNTKVRKISISEEFFPRLKTLNLGENKDLEKVDLTLTTTLEGLFLSSCSSLKSISGISDLAKLKELEMSGCCELEELPSVANLSALERFTADKCWMLQKTGGVERLERLKDFRLVADNGAIWNCFHGLQRLPSHQMILGGRAVQWISHLSLSNFLDGTAVDSFTEIEKEYAIKVKNSSCTAVLIICFTIESFRQDSMVRFWWSRGESEKPEPRVVLINAGEWIVAGFFVIEEASASRNPERLQIFLAKSSHYKLKKVFAAMVNRGEHEITQILNTMFVSTKDAMS